MEFGTFSPEWQISEDDRKKNYGIRNIERMNKDGNTVNGRTRDVKRKRKRKSEVKWKDKETEGARCGRRRDREADRGQGEGGRDAQGMK